MRGGGEVGAGGRFVAGAERLRAVQCRALEKAGEDRRALFRVRRPRHPRVLGADGGFVLPEASGWLAEDGEVDVDQEGGVGDGGGIVRFGAENQCADVRDDGGIDVRGCEAFDGEGGAIFFVGGRVRIVDGVVKPERGGDEFGVGREGVSVLQLIEALGDMLEIVIVPLRLCIGGNEPRVPGLRIAVGAEFGPERGP